MKKTSKPSVSAASYPAGLSAREAEVLNLVAQGLTNTKIAEELFISPRTVDRHLNSVYAKLKVGSRAAATRFAIEHGLS
jgi:DNA-binding NarL/FixJ family response regulator